MIRYLAFVAALSLAGSALAQTASETVPSITVVGFASVERAPDRFTVLAGVEGQGDTQVEALAQLAERQNKILANLQALERLTIVDLSTGKPSVQAMRDPTCEDSYSTTVACPIVGYLAETSISLRGAPVERAGDAVSLAAESGATTANIQAFSLADTKALHEEADASAFANARRQADQLATASNQRIARVLRIENPDIPRGPRLQTGDIDIDALVARVPIGRNLRSVALLAPRVLLNVTPEPVVVTSRLVVVFEME